MLLLSAFYYCFIFPPRNSKFFNQYYGVHSSSLKANVRWVDITKKIISHLTDFQFHPSIPVTRTKTQNNFLSSPTHTNTQTARQYHLDECFSTEADSAPPIPFPGGHLGAGDIFGWYNLGGRDCCWPLVGGGWRWCQTPYNAQDSLYNTQLPGWK